MLIYVAAPGFNCRQRWLIEEVADLIKRSGHAPLLPFEAEASIEAAEKGMSLLRAQRIFEANCTMIRNCDWVLAIMDYRLSDSAQRMVILDLDGKPLGGDKGNLMIPDSGVIWEMGFAKGIGKPIVAVWPLCMKKNIMLGMCADFNIIDIEVGLGSWLGQLGPIHSPEDLK